MKISSAIVGRETGPTSSNVDARWLMAYSAGLGERDFPHPLFPVCYEWPATRQLRERAGLVPIDARLVHAQHDLIIHRGPEGGKAFHQRENRCRAAAQAGHARRLPLHDAG